MKFLRKTNMVPLAPFTTPCFHKQYMCHHNNTLLSQQVLRDYLFSKEDNMTQQRNVKEPPVKKSIRFPRNTASIKTPYSAWRQKETVLFNWRVILSACNAVAYQDKV